MLLSNRAQVKGFDDGGRGSVFLLRRLGHLPGDQHPVVRRNLPGPGLPRRPGWELVHKVGAEKNVGAVEVDRLQALPIGGDQLHEDQEIGFVGTVVRNRRYDAVEEDRLADNAVRRSVDRGMETRKRKGEIDDIVEGLAIRRNRGHNQKS